MGFVKTTGGKPELSSAQFIANYVIKRKQVFQLMDPVNGRYPLFIDIDLDFMERPSTRTRCGTSTWRRPRTSRKC